MLNFYRIFSKRDENMKINLATLKYLETRKCAVLLNTKYITKFI